MNQILVIDDEITIVEVLSMFLQGEGYKVETALNGQEGLDSLTRVRPDLILCDVMMPGVDGREVCRRLQADVRYQSIPIVLMSAMISRFRFTDCITAAFVEKPFDLDDMLHTIVEVLHSHRSDIS